MKLSESWLREWVNPNLSREKLIEKLNLSGLAIESCEPYENDHVFEFELTPNRGDCLSALGIAREVAALTQCSLHHISQKKYSAKQKTIGVKINSPQFCPRYLGRQINNISAGKKTPTVIEKKLLKSGVNLIHPVVDITNYVMYELGQPLHAFDLTKINKHIVVRLAKPGEKILLLDKREITLDDKVLVIADAKGPIAMAGMLGGLDSGVTEQTTAIFLEVAFFVPEIVGKNARRFGIHTDGSHRFERGVDPELSFKAIDRATELLADIYPDLEVTGDIEKTNKKYLPKLPKIKLRPKRVLDLLGYDISEKKAHDILKNLNMTVTKNTVVPPSYRFDIAQEVDLIEEIARVYGYEHVPTIIETRQMTGTVSPENIKPLSHIKEKMVTLGYQEVVSYSFISHELEQKISQKGDASGAHVLENPLSAELAVMRSSLWGSLIEIVKHNLNRQQDYLKFFETGVRFLKNGEEPVLSGIWAGLSSPEQWGEKKRNVDFFDIKNTVEQLNSRFSFKIGSHPALYPAQTAEIFLDNKSVGFCGALHPELQKYFDIGIPVFLLELSLDAIIYKLIPHYTAISKFPSIRRDISLTMNKKVSAHDLQAFIQKTAGSTLQEVTVFDVYKQSIALRLVFQLIDRTLVEDEINQLMNKIISGLTQNFDVTLRA